MPITKAQQVAEPVANIAGKNFIINGAMDVWQRGTSGFTNGGFTADRMLSDNGATASRSTDAPTGFTYSIRWTTPGAANCVIRQGIELPAAGAQGAFSDGETFTFSIYAKSSVAGKALTLYAAFADGTNGTARRTVVNNIVIGTTTTSWARYTYTFTIPAGASISPAVCLQITPYVVTPNADVYMTGMQVEAGSVATPFSRAAGTIQGELSACQRYYWRIKGGPNNYVVPAVYTIGTNQWEGVVSFPVEMRATPTVVVAIGTNYYTGLYLPTLQFNEIKIFAPSVTNTLCYMDGLSGLVANRPGAVTYANASASLAFSAEL
jgi:hypothetical protein